MIKKKLTIKKEFFAIGFMNSALLSIFFLLIVIGGIYEYEMQAAKDRLKSNNVQISTYVDTNFRNLAFTVNLAAENENIKSYESGKRDQKSEILDYYKTIKKTNGNIQYIFSAYESGELLIDDYQVDDRYNPRIRPWYSAALERYPETIVGLSYNDYMNDYWLVSVSKALYSDEGRLNGVVALDYSLEYVSRLMNDTTYFDSQMNYALDSKGKIIIHPENRLIKKDLDEIIGDTDANIAGSSGYFDYVYVIDGSEKFAYYNRLEVNDWTIVSVIDKNEIYSPIYKKILYILVLFLPVSMLLGGIVVKVYQKRFVNPINVLTQRIEDIVQGKKVKDYDNKFFNSELESIARHIEEMTESSLGRKAHELKVILESTSDGILVLDNGGRIIQSNSRFYDIWEFDRSQKIDSYSELDLVSKVVKDSNNKIESNFVQSALKTELFEVKLKNGRKLEVYICNLNENEKIDGRLLSFRDITEKTRAVENLKYLANTDELTEMRNRRYFMEILRNEFEKARRYDGFFSLIQIDIDHFKIVNDTYGHTAGDEALRFFSRNTARMIGKDDTFSRIGGEEFTIILPDMNQDEASELAETIRRFFDSNNLNYGGHSIGFTISIGVACFNKSMDNEDKMIKFADQACYQAKKAGRNRVEVYKG